MPDGAAQRRQGTHDEEIPVDQGKKSSSRGDRLPIASVTVALTEVIPLLFCNFCGVFDVF